jgi:arylformamidase
MTDAASPAADRERDYSPSSCIGGDYRPFVEAYALRSAQARREVETLGGRWVDIACASRAMPRVEIALPGGDMPRTGWPLLVFIHGGYWQELSARESLFAAGEAVAAGIAFAAVDYTLAPKVTIGAIVDECRDAHACLTRQAATFHVDAGRIVLAGHSAGAHLATMVALAAREAVAGLVLVSGVYDLEPLVGTSINEALRMDASAARNLSPSRRPLHGMPPAVVCWGDNETGAFKAQSRDFASQLVDSGVPCRSFEVPGRHHFDVVLDLMHAGTPLGDATRALLAPHDTPPVPAA